MAEQEHESLLEDLHVGFGALMEKVDQLMSKNQDLEQQLRDYLRHSSRSIGLPGEEVDGLASLEAAGKAGSWRQDKEVARGIGAYERFKTDLRKQAPLSSRESQPAAPPVEAEHDHCKRNSMEHDYTTPGTPGELKCPFSTNQANLPSNHANGSKDRPSSLPTPPDLKEPAMLSDPIAAEFHADAARAPSSAADSAPKCPIRFLDVHSPEEVAAYFQNHKHEIPRSHAVCVQRYQSNAASIRRLDAKYGSLVSMIHGLGAKHQPLLPVAEDGSAADTSEEKIVRQKPLELVEQWAMTSADSDGSSSETNRGLDPSEHAQRTPRFDRPLQDIRLGESPSRPWGIQVPEAQQRAASAESEAGSVNRPRTILETIDPEPVPDAEDAKPWSVNGDGVDAPPSRIKEEDGLNWFTASHTGGPKPLDTAASPEDKPVTNSNVIFNGPVFLGYSADDASSLLKGLTKAKP